MCQVHLSVARGWQINSPSLHPVCTPPMDSSLVYNQVVYCSQTYSPPLSCLLGLSANMMRLPKMVVFDLDDCLWHPEMHELSGCPKKPVIGDLGNGQQGVIGAQTSGRYRCLLLSVNPRSMGPLAEWWMNSATSITALLKCDIYMMQTCKFFSPLNTQCCIKPSTSLDCHGGGGWVLGLAEPGILCPHSSGL